MTSTRLNNEWNTICLLCGHLWCLLNMFWKTRWLFVKYGKVENMFCFMRLSCKNVLVCGYFCFLSTFPNELLFSFAIISKQIQNKFWDNNNNNRFNLPPTTGKWNSWNTSTQYFYWLIDWLNSVMVYHFKCTAYAVLIMIQLLPHYSMASARSICCFTICVIVGRLHW